MVFKTLIFKICYLFSFNESSLFYKHLNEIEKYINQFFKYVRIELQALTLVPCRGFVQRMSQKYQKFRGKYLL